MICVVTGTNRGIGFALTKELLSRGHEVHATARNPEQATGLKGLKEKFGDKLQIYQLDIADHQSVKRFAEELTAERIDLLINNAGIMDKGNRFPNISMADVEEVVKVDALAHLDVTLALVDKLKHGINPKIVNITSILGSIELVKDFGTDAYGYRIGKAALNMISRLLAFDLMHYGISVYAVHPGWVRTRMGGEAAPILPEESARGIIDTVSKLTINDSGGYFDWQGRRLPW